MPTPSVFFYGSRRYRSSRTFDDLTSSSSSSSPSASDSTTTNHRHRYRHRHRRRQVSFDDVDDIRPPSNLPQPPLLATLPESEPQQTGCIGESSLQGTTNRETVRDLSRSYGGNNRLPGPVLLARERLLQRLRGVSVSGARQSGETSPSFHCNDFWVVDADWETNGFREPPTADATLAELPAEAGQVASEEPKKKPLGLTKETLSELHHEVFTQCENASTHLPSKASNDCSICLENFVEGNELTSLTCGHRFHTSCLYPWLRTCGECPNCRSCIMLAS